MDNSDEISPDGWSWLNAHRTVGNWFDVDPDEEIPPGVVGNYRSIISMFQLTFTPEIKRRISENALEEKFMLHSAQFIQRNESEKYIRFNKEIQGNIRVRTSDTLLINSCNYHQYAHDIVAFDLIDSEMDFSHFTLISNGDDWFLSFDFRYGRRKAQHMIGLAFQYADIAKLALERGYYESCVENLFTACEQLSKAQLIIHRDPAANSKTHGSISSAINLWGKIGNIDRSFVSLFNRLSQYRDSARYGSTSISYKIDHSDIDLVIKYNNILKQICGSKVPTSSGV